MADRLVISGISIRETSGREGTDNLTGGSTAERTFLIRGSSSPLSCRAALLAAAPTLGLLTYDGMKINSISRERLADEDWEFTVAYDELTPEEGGYTIDLDASGGTVRITNALAANRYVATGETAPDYGTAIDVQDGAAQGVDRIIPAIKFNVKAKIPKAVIESGPGTTLAFGKAIGALVGTYNNSLYLTCAAGELLLASVTGPLIDNSPTLNFTFLFSPNITGMTIGSISGINKLGHDYLWYDFQQEKDPAGFTIAKPVSAYVNRVYGPANFSDLLIGAT